MPKISELTAMTTLADTDYTVMVDDESTDVTSKVTVATLRTAMHSRTQAVPVMAGSWRPRSSSGCGALTAVSAGSGQPDIVYLPFDASSNEYAQFWLAMPSSWNEGTITAKVHWSHAATTTNFAAVWGIQATAFSNDDARAAAFGTAVTVTDTGGTTDDLYTSDSTSAMTVAGTPAAGDLVCFQVFRDAAAGGDNLAVDARLEGVTLFITHDAATDS